MWRTTALLGILVVLCLCVEIEGRRRHRRNCPTDAYEDRVCCNMVVKNVTFCDFYWTTCDDNEPKTYWDYLECANKHEQARRKRSNHDDSHEHYDDDYWDDWWNEDDGCLKYRPFNFTFEYCEAYCCNGWKEDQYGFCTIREDQMMDIVCENGGSPSDDGQHCMCPTNFIGVHCETPVCTPACQNLGNCTARDGQPYCVCRHGFTGQSCETVVCEQDCQNGGDCVSIGYGSHCSCTPGYYGNACEHKVKEGDCPEVDEDVFGTCAQECAHDSECGGKSKCCSNGCGHICMAPVNSSICVYNGKQYPVGAQIDKDPCTHCTCLGHVSPHSDGFACAVMDCPSHFASFSCPPNTAWKSVSGKCCPECIDESPKTTPAPVPPPAFKNCPKDTVRVDVDDNNQVNLKVALKHIVATDHKGNVLSLTYSKVTLSHCACPEHYKNFHQITATTMPDGNGKIGNCSMTVKVHDPKPPKFLTCPSNIQAFDDELVSWMKPTVKDNVGVRNTTLVSSLKNNTMITAGSHMLTYLASDHQGNMAICTFLVEVWKRESADPSMPSTLNNRRTDQHWDDDDMDKRRLHWVVAPVLGVLLLIIAVAVIVVCCRRKSREARSPQHAYGNGGYTGYVEPPPGYDNVLKEKYPPPYTSSEPPVYQEVEKNKLPDGTGIDNPVYADPEEVKVSVQNLANIMKS